MSVTVKDLKEYLDNFQDDDPVCAVGAYKKTELQTRLVDLIFIGGMKPEECKTPIFVMEVQELPEEEAAE